jgi:hypothetical protein
MQTSDKFKEAIESQIEYFRREFDLTYSEAIGVLEMCKLDLYQEQVESEE